VKFHFDRETDVLDLSVGKPQKTRTIEIGEDFVLRFTSESGQVVGLTIINFSKHFPQLRFSIPMYVQTFAERKIEQEKLRVFTVEPYAIMGANSEV
jgi:uncharacterized protein YuzE